MTRKEYDSFRRWKKRRADRRASRQETDEHVEGPPPPPPSKDMETETQPPIPQHHAPTQQQKPPPPPPGPLDTFSSGLSTDTIEKLTHREAKWMTAILSRLVSPAVPPPAQPSPSFPPGAQKQPLGENVPQQASPDQGTSLEALDQQQRQQTHGG